MLQAEYDPNPDPNPNPPNPNPNPNPSPNPNQVPRATEYDPESPECQKVSGFIFG